MTTTDTKSIARSTQIWIQVPEKCVHNLPEFTQADTIRKTTIAALKKNGQANTYQVKVRKYPLRAKQSVQQTFSVLVFKRLHDRLNVSHGVTGSDSYTIDMSKNNELVLANAGIASAEGPVTVKYRNIDHVLNRKPPVAGIVQPEDIDPSNLTATHNLKNDKKRDRRHRGGKKSKAS